MIFFNFFCFLSFSVAVECFTRIYEEAMLPRDRAFRTSETSSLQVCREQCMEEGKRCQSFALGISTQSGGNGTCQLSSDRIFENGGRRPRNTVYDPNFNLYQRKENCGINNNNDMPPKLEGKHIILSNDFDFNFIFILF